VSMEVALALGDELTLPEGIHVMVRVGVVTDEELALPEKTELEG